jgi:ribosomal protein S18 acetylase RimI-like enzyme
VARRPAANKPEAVFFSMIDYDLDIFNQTDQAELEDLFRKVWDAPFRPEDLHSDLRNIPNVYQSDRGNFWIMRISGTIIGTVAIKNLGENIAEVKRLAVHPDFRGQRLGSALFQHSLDYARKKGFKAVRLDSIRNPGPAMYLYEKHGFVEIPRYNDNPNANIFMELTMS